MIRAREWLAVLALLAADAVAAATTLEVDRLRSGTILAQGLELTLEPQRQLRLSIERVHFTALDFRLDSVRIDCALARDDARWHCEGRVRFRDGDQGRRAAWSLRAEADGASLAIAPKGGRLDVRFGDDATRIDAERFPLAWTRRLLEASGLALARLEGRLDGRVTLGAEGGWDAKLTATALDFDRVDGGLAGAKAELELEAKAAARKNAATQLNATLASGEWLYGPVYVAIVRPLRLAATVHREAEVTHIEGISIDDGDALSVRGAARGLGTASAEIALEHVSARFPAAHDRYFATPLATAGWPALVTEGRVEILDARHVQGRLQQGALKVESLSVTDPAGRVSVAQLDGTLALDGAPHALSWRAGSLFGIEIGTARASLRAGPGRVELTAPLALPMLGGEVVLERFAHEGERGRFEASLRVADLSLEALGRHLGWPTFPGRIDASIPRVAREGDVLRFDGEVQADVFGGTVRIGALQIERPFGPAMSLAADASLSNLDLAAITSTFDFGRIEGRLDGTVRGLRLLDGTPVAFDARLATNRQKPRRISQRAVQGLSSVGGGGGAAALQGAVLGLFDTFPYAKLGLSCRLANGVCAMDGIDSAGRGYVIVRGSGVPRLTVVGHERRVDWPVLVARLKAATAGGGPVIR